MDTEEALHSLGNVGKWQILLFNLWGVTVCGTACFQLSIPVFTAFRPEFQCKVPNSKYLPWKNSSLMNKDCYQYPVNVTEGKNGLISCENGKVWFTNLSRSSIVSEFDLVCAREDLAELTVTLAVLGSFIGTSIWASLSDQFGRKKVHFATNFLTCIFSLATAFSNDYMVYTALRTLTGFFNSGVLASALTAIYELFSSEVRTTAGCLIPLHWSMFAFILCLLAYFIRGWRNLQIAISVIPMVIIIPMWFVVPETLPWLAENDADAADTYLRKAAKMNKIDLPDGALVNRNSHNDKNLKGKQDPSEKNKLKGLIKRKTKSSDNADKQASFKLLFSHRILIKNAAIMAFIWFTNVLIYWGVSYITIMLSDNMYLDFTLQAAAEIPSVFVITVLLPKWGRRLPLSLFHVGAGTAFLVACFLPAGKDFVILKVILQFLTKFFITSSFDEILLYTNELFPTMARTTACGFVSTISCIAGMAAPYSLKASRNASWLPGVIFAAFSFVSAFIGLFLAETQNRPLPETVEQVVLWDKKQRFFDFSVPKKEQVQNNDENVELKNGVVET